MNEDQLRQLNKSDALITKPVSSAVVKVILFAVGASFAAATLTFMYLVVIPP